MSLSACGKKPSHVDPPDDDAPKFPATYPDQSTIIYPAPSATITPSPSK